MARTLSVDLRQRVVYMIGQEISRRQAAAQFGVSAASTSIKLPNVIHMSKPLPQTVIPPK
jgi:hypothetical protein